MIVTLFGGMPEAEQQLLQQLPQWHVQGHAEQLAPAGVSWRRVLPLPEGGCGMAGASPAGQAAVAAAVKEDILATCSGAPAAGATAQERIQTQQRQLQPLQQLQPAQPEKQVQGDEAGPAQDPAQGTASLQTAGARSFRATCAAISLTLHDAARVMEPVRGISDAALPGGHGHLPGSNLHVVLAPASFEEHVPGPCDDASVSAGNGGLPTASGNFMRRHGSVRGR